MDTFIQLSEQERREAFDIAAAQLDMTAAAVEKDFWVCWVLKKLFEDPLLSAQCMFKGGTSLSKCFQLIQRFSEDIDLILDWNILPETKERGPLDDRSKNQQDKLNKSLNTSAQRHIANIIFPRLQQLLAPHCQTDIDSLDPHTINVHYPALFAAGYLRPQVRLEIGPLAAKLPSADYPVNSYVAEQLPTLFANEVSACKVIAIKPERTFWEKATILHAEAHRPEAKPQPNRYARHYYDLYCMARSSTKQTAFNEIHWLANVIAYKQRFYPSAWANYDTAQPPTLNLVPSEQRLAALAKDYANMQAMLFGSNPSWEQIVEGLKKLETEANRLGPNNQ